MTSFGSYNYSDVKTLPLDSPETKGIAVCKILYSEEYKKLMSCLRGLMAVNELSPRALYMTELVIGKVAAHYTVWLYRYKNIKKIVEETDKEGWHRVLEDELKWCGRVALANEKNYQIWHYREDIIELMISHLYGGDSDKYDVEKEEFPIIETLIDRDEKNYHVWTHRRWLVERFKMYGSPRELEFTEKRLAEDVRNNSAWNHRFFVLFGGKGEEFEADFDTELGFVKRQVCRSPTNPSSWNYLRGICAKKGFVQLKEFVTQFTEQKETDPVIPALEILAEIYKEEKQQDKWREVYEQLKKVDPIRQNYWESYGV
ncbi:hypothetical protein FOA43_002517 [Brettanomyces nanus]|uniref:Protein farnesyltransferase/geranylgeranyltransferase type-1 subunit alpha n=1 Tax=Eeniella nana TaxID=13502 RepID=A0A875S601_EENNA|nr:uncharacterized protein FOA43_002517 [Brettanomyces nanus]QPG75169.1 hypothetical protein FOA43_002517 [Brettanomyces nanus]